MSKRGKKKGKKQSIPHGNPCELPNDENSDEVSGQNEQNVQTLGLRNLWSQWEKAWCKALNWDQTKLNEYWQKKLGVGMPSIFKGLRIDLDRHESLLLFYAMFRYAYTDALQKVENNKDMNFTHKKRFIALLKWTIVVHVLLCVVFAVLLVLGLSTDHMIAIEAFVLFVFFLSSLIITKNLDINKYQETWSRHRNFQYQRNQEMLRFLLLMEPYKKAEDGDNVDRFVKAILDIEGKNIEKFCDNMDTKEMSLLGEVLSLLKKK